MLIFDEITEKNKLAVFIAHGVDSCCDRSYPFIGYCNVYNGSCV